MKYTFEQQKMIEQLQHDYRLKMGYGAVGRIDRIFRQAFIYAGLTASSVDGVFFSVAEKLEAELKDRVKPAKDSCAAAGVVLGEFEARVNAAVDAAAKNPDKAELFR